MRYEDAWRWQDAIEAAVNALGFTVWSLDFNQEAGVFELELNEQLDEEALSAICYQLPLTTDYEGEGTQGSRFVLTP
jgi:hypothetical protein